MRYLFSIATHNYALTMEISIVIALVALYFLPLFIAAGRNHENATAIGVLTVLLGWTALGWIVAFVWSFTGPGSDRRKPVTPTQSPNRKIKPCPLCGEEILAVAVRCKHCQADLVG